MRNVRQTMIMLWYIGAPAGFLLLGCLGIVHWGFPPLAFLWVFLLAYLVKRIPCPNCGRPIGWSKYKFLGMDAESGVPPRHCTHCGYDLTGKGK
jgi:hypothetical protein